MAPVGHTAQCFHLGLILQKQDSTVVSQLKKDSTTVVLSLLQQSTWLWQDPILSKQDSRYNKTSYKKNSAARHKESLCRRVIIEVQFQVEKLIFTPVMRLLFLALLILNIPMRIRKLTVSIILESVLSQISRNEEDQLHKDRDYYNISS